MNYEPHGCSEWECLVFKKKKKQRLEELQMVIENLGLGKSGYEALDSAGAFYGTCIQNHTSQPRFEQQASTGDIS